MNRRRNILLGVILVVVALVATFVLYRLEQQHQREIRETDLAADALETPSEDEVEVDQNRVVLYLYRAVGDGPRGVGLATEVDEIAVSVDPIERAQRIVGAVIQHSEGVLSAAARVRQVYLLPGGTMVVDLSQETADQLTGGVDAELGVLRSITRSLTENISEVKRVRFLVNGEDRPTFAGHVSIRAAFM